MHQLSFNPATLARAPGGRHFPMKTGRNGPCPCGSERKFKHCCGAVQAMVEPPEHFTWRRLRRLRDEQRIKPPLDPGIVAMSRERLRLPKA
jgi:hypothetical protein